MAVSYTCPNPDCGATLKSPNPVPVGKKVKCPKCQQPFTPEANGAAPAGPGTFKLADEGPPAKKGPAVKGQPKKASPAGKKPHPDDDEDDESIKRGYGVVKESEEELEEAERNKPKFTEVQDKFKKSARGPAISMLVTPVNLMTAVGLITVVAGLVLFVVGLWPLVFNDASPGDEELEDAIINMILGLVIFGWGALVCVGASQMQDLSSYTWSMVGAVMAIPLAGVGLFALTMLLNKRVKAGFEEMVGALDDDEDDDDRGGGGGDDDDDDDDGGGGGLLGGLLGGDDD
jgi:hypothetical protein